MMNGNEKDITREEDFRDFKERDIDEGWPYDDDAGAKSEPVGNRAYGETAANFDRETNKGYIVTDVDADGNEETQSDAQNPGTDGRADRDDIEERVTDVLMDLGGVSAEQIDVHVEDGVVTLEGEVDDRQFSEKLKRLALGVPGVTNVKNNLNVIGVDARIPNDD